MAECGSLREVEGRWVISDLVFLIGTLYLIGRWFGEDRRANILKAYG